MYPSVVPFEVVKKSPVPVIYPNTIFAFRLLLAVTLFLLMPGISIFAQWSTDPAVNTSVAPFTNSAGAPITIADQYKNVIIGWSDRPAGGLAGKIYLQKLNERGELLWGPAGISIPAAKTQSIAAAVADGSGGIIIAIVQEEGDNIVGVYTNYYIQHITASGHIDWPAPGIPITQGILHKGVWGMVADQKGGAFIALTEQHDKNSNVILYLQHLEANGSMGWPGRGIALSSSLETLGFASLSLTKENNLVAAWGLHQPNLFSIRAQMIEPDGNIKWKQGPVEIVRNNHGCDLPTIVPDGQGAIIAWLDKRLGNGSAIYAQKINKEGLLMWEANGVNAGREVGWQRGPQMVSDNAGGAIITWDDYRYGQQALNSHAQRINKNGIAQWTEHGVRICPSPIRQYWTSIASDGLNGAFITWKDNRYGGPGDIYAQHVDSSGNLSWTENGVVISSAQNGQSFPFITSIPGSSAVIAWRDNRTIAEPEYGIFAQNVTLGGKIGCFTTHITAQPISFQTVPLNGISSDLVVTTSGDDTKFQWFTHTTSSRDGAVSLYPLGTNATFTPPAWEEGIRYYYCRISSCDTIYSDFAEVKVVANISGLQVIISPNPSESFFNVTVKSPAMSKVEIRLYDMLGRLAESKQGFPSNQFRMGESVAAGVYVVEAIQGEEKVRRKVVKQ